MKLIPKWQQGGQFMPLFAKYNSIQMPQSSFQQSAPAPSRSKSEDSIKGKITEDKLFGLLNSADTLPNETQAIYSLITQLYDSVSTFGSLSTAESLSDEYAKVITQIKIANFNKKEYDKAYSEVQKNNGLSEIAVTVDGKIVAYNKDEKVIPVNVKEYFNNPSKYQPLTNSNLLYLRAHNPEYIDNNLIFDTIQNGIGMEKIHSMIQSRLGSLGTTEQNLSGYSIKQQENIKLGLQVLDEASQKEISSGMTIDGLYKSKIINKDQKQQALSALNYIYESLPENAKTILKLHSGNMEDPTQGAKSLIGTLITSRLNESKLIDNDLQSNLNVDGAKKEGTSESSLGKMELNTASNFIAGRGQAETFTINPGTIMATQVNATTLPLVKKDGTPLGAGCSLQEISEGQYNGILDWNNVSMGGRHINPTYFNQVLVNDGQIRSIDFPVDANGNPDLRPTTIEAKQKADQLMQQAKIDINDPISRANNSETINQILQEVGLNAAYDSQGNIVAGNWRRFGVMNGTADEKTLGVDFLESPYLLEEITDESRIDAILQNLEAKTKIVPDFDKNDWGWLEFGYDRLLEGTIWIPLNVNYFSAQAGSGEKMTVSQGNQLQELQLMHDKKEQLMHSYNNPGQI